MKYINLGKEQMKKNRVNILQKGLLCILLMSMNTALLSAAPFDLDTAIKKCQKCHGAAFDKRVLNVTKKISEFSKDQLLQSFDLYLNTTGGGRQGLMKIILKKYTKEQREQIAEYIVNHTQK